MKKCIAIVVAVAACNGPQVDLGGGQSDASSSESDSAIPDDAPQVLMRCGASSSAACGYAGTCSDGAGYLANLPGACVEAVGAQQTFATTDEVTASLVGAWTTCAARGDPFVKTLDPNSIGVEFGSDGHFTLLVEAAGPSASDTFLVPGTGAIDSGTFAVVDASATLGAGTYQLRLSASDGGVYTTQVVVLDAGTGPRLRLFEPTADDYARAPTANYQAGVCGAPFGPIVTPSSEEDLLSRLQGRWARCPILGSTANSSDGSIVGTSPGVIEGLEFAGNGTWYLLVEDVAGHLVRSTNPAGSLTVSFTSSSIMLKMTDSVGVLESQPVIGSCGTLNFNAGDRTLYDFVHVP
jgi:hypothetical protein